MNEATYIPLAAPINNNPVTTICRNEKIEWNTRNEARKFFFSMYNALPLSEREPYGTVLFWLLIGRDVCTDGN